MTTHEEMPSIQIAVDREAQHRKRVFSMFLLLLLIPVAIGIFAIVRAPSETDVVARNVTPIVEKSVQESVNEKIEPRVAEIVERRATPVIEQTLDKAVIARVQPLENSYRMLAMQGDENVKTAERVKELEARVAALEERLAALAANQPTGVNPNLKIDRIPVTHVPKKDP